MNSSTDFRTARALYPNRPPGEELGYFYEPLPLPVEHPELNLVILPKSRAGEPVPAIAVEEKDEESAGPQNRAMAKAAPPSRLDEAMPSRMLNEFVYCPRLFYYEYVEGVFVDNEDTERGSALHAKVDKGKGDLPPASAKSASKTSAAKVSATPTATVAVVPTKARKRSGATQQEELGGGLFGPDSLQNKGHTKPQALSSDSVGSVGKHPDHIADPSPDSDGDPERSPQDPESIAWPLTGSAISEEPEQETSESSGQNPDEDVDESERTIHSRSPTLSSERLGVVAKLDLIEIRMGASNQVGSTGVLERQMKSVIPVDYKAGAPKKGADANELWDADKMQLGLQILILRDNGYTCDEGVIYYRATKQRVRLPMTEALERWVIEQIQRARATAQGPMPPPLVGSPKCVRCSLAPVCLPDETRMLAKGREDSPGDLDEAGEGGRNGGSRNRNGTPGAPRRLMAARDDERALYLVTPGLHVGRSDELLVVKDGTAVVEQIRARDLTHVALFGNIQITTQAVQMLCEMEIPLAYFSTGGWFYGLTRGHVAKNVFTRIEQFRTAGDPIRCLALARKFVSGKIRNHRTLLMRLHVDAPSAVLNRLRQASQDVLAAESIEALLGMEGAAAALYFQNFSGMVKSGPVDDDEIPGLEMPKGDRAPEPELFTFDFTKRSRRPPTDPVNALLSLAYSLLAKDCTIAAHAVGFDPYVGFYHQPRYGRPALALDLMEEFRPLIAESVVLTVINNRMLTPGHFVRAGEGVNLNKAGRRVFFQAYEHRMGSIITHPVFDYKVSYRRVLELQARILARYLTGEIPEYIPMVTR